MFVGSIRKKTGCSIEEVASRIGMTIEEWEQVEDGTLLPNTPEQVQVLAYALDVEWDAMVEIVSLCRNAWA
jgi:transcriptional regulator with XRE-family HTH domain